MSWLLLATLINLGSRVGCEPVGGLVEISNGVCPRGRALFASAFFEKACSEDVESVLAARGWREIRQIGRGKRGQMAQLAI